MRTKLILLFLLASACGDNGKNPSVMDASTQSDGGTMAGDGGAMLKALPSVPQDPGGGAVLLTVSGEQPAVDGWPFPPASMDDTFLADGWEFKLDRYIGVFDKVTLWDQPNLVPAQQA